MAKGKKTGGGSRAGTRNRRTLAVEAIVERTAAQIAETIPGAFAGDAHSLLMWVYKDPANPLQIRVDAAKAAAPYEKPRLNAVTMDGSLDLSLHTWLTEARRAEDGSVSVSQIGR
jgi:hypothetical protein